MAEGTFDPEVFDWDTFDTGDAVTPPAGDGIPDQGYHLRQFEMPLFLLSQF